LLNEDELQNAVVLVFANKQDLPGAMPVDQVPEKFISVRVGFYSSKFQHKYIYLIFLSGSYKVVLPLMVLVYMKVLIGWLQLSAKKNKYKYIRRKTQYAVINNLFLTLSN